MLLGRALAVVSALALTGGVVVGSSASGDGQRTVTVVSHGRGMPEPAEEGSLTSTDLPLPPDLTTAPTAGGDASSSSLRQTITFEVRRPSDAESGQSTVLGVPDFEEETQVRTESGG